MATSQYAEAVYRVVPRMTRCVEVGFHTNPHLDEVGQLWLAADFGEDHFPYLADARFVFNGVGAVLFQGKPWEQHWREGRLLLGTGGGPLDEHQRVGGRISGQCGMSLMADFLGRRDDPALKPLLDYVLGNDASGQRQGRFDLAGIMRVGYSYSGLTPEEMVFKGALDFRAWYRQQAAFLACGSELLQKSSSGLAIAEEVAVGGRKFRLALVDQNTNREMASYLRHIGAQVIIIRSPRGNTQVFWPQDAEMADAVAFIRIREAQLSGCALAGDPRAEGYAQGAENWYFTGWALLNGSDSYPETPPTKVSLEEIVQIVKTCIRPKQ